MHPDTGDQAEPGNGTEPDNEDGEAEVTEQQLDEIEDPVVTDDDEEDDDPADGGGSD